MRIVNEIEVNVVDHPVLAENYEDIYVDTTSDDWSEIDSEYEKE